MGYIRRNSNNTQTKVGEIVHHIPEQVRESIGNYIQKGKFDEKEHREQITLDISRDYPLFPEYIRDKRLIEFCKSDGIQDSINVDVKGRIICLSDINEKNYWLVERALTIARGDERKLIRDDSELWLRREAEKALSFKITYIENLLR